MKTLIHSLLVVTLFLCIGFTRSTYAQDGACSPEQTNQWNSESERIFVQFQAVDIENGVLDAVSALQSLRREFTALERPECPDTDFLYDAYLNMLNKAADSIVARLTGNNELASELFAQVQDLEGSIRSGDVAAQAQSSSSFAITVPENGAALDDYIVDVEGTFDPNTLGDNVLWLFHVPLSTGLYFPAADVCDTESPNSLNQRRNRWHVTAYLGSAVDGGGDYELVLMRGDGNADTALNQELAQWCAASQYPGFNEDELTVMGFEEVSFIEVSR